MTMRFYFHNTSAAFCLLAGLFLWVPASAQDGDPRAGEAVYGRQGCGGCHNTGVLGAPILATGNWQERFDNERNGLSGYAKLEDAVGNGVLPNMPARPDLTPAQIKNVVAYLLQEADVNTGPAVKPPGKISDTDPAPNQIAEDAGNGAYTGITAAAENSTRYTLVDNAGAGSRFSIVADGDSSGRVTVADNRLINYEESTRHQVIVRASNTAGSSTKAFTIQIINVHEITLQDTLPGDNMVDAVSNAEVQGLELRAVHADDEPIVAWTIKETEAFEGMFEFTESQNSNTQKLRISQSDKSIPDGSASVDITARTKHDRADLSLRIQIKKVEVPITAKLQNTEVAEGKRTTLVLSMSRTLPAEVFLLVSVTDDGSRDLIMLSTDTVNFVPGPITAAIAAAERSATLTIRVDDDGLAAAQRTAVLQVTSRDEKLTELPQNLSLSITADAKAEISLEPTAFMLSEDQSQVINLTLSPPTAEPVTVTAAIAEADQNQIALLRDGSQVTQSTVSFTDNGMFTVHAVNDDVTEMEQMHAVTLEVSAGHADLMPDQDEITVTIPANDPPTITAKLAKVITPDGFDAMTIIPEGQSATLTVAIQPAPAGNVTVRLSVAQADPPQVTLRPAELILSSESTQAQALVHVINDDTPENKQDIEIVLTPEDGSVTIQDPPTFTIPQSYSNTAFCEALNTIGNCPAFFALPDSHAPWRVADRDQDAGSRSGNQVGPTVLRSGNISHSQRSCLSFIAQQPTRIVFGWRTSSQNKYDLLFYIDDNDRSDVDRVGDDDFRNSDGFVPSNDKKSKGYKYRTGYKPFRGQWFARQLNYLGNDPLMLEWCYAKDRYTDRGKDAGFLDNLQIIPTGSVQARLSPTRIPEPGRADLMLLHNLEQDTTVKLAFAKGTPKNVRIDRLRPKGLKLKSAESRTTATLTIEDDGILQEERSGTLTMALSPDNQAVMLSNTTFTFTIPKDIPMVTAELSKAFTPDGFDAMTIIPEGQSATLTVAFQPSFATNVTVRLSVIQADPPQITLSTTQLVLNPESNQIPVIVHVIDDNAPEDLQTIKIVLTPEDGSITVQATPTFTIPRSYSNTAFCEALNTINCPVFFTLPDSHAPWRVADRDPDAGSRSGNQVGPTALQSGNISDNQRSCLSFIAQQPTRILFDWRVSSKDEFFDGILYIDENNRKKRLNDVGDLSNTKKSLTGNRVWGDRKFDYSGDGALVPEWCYVKDPHDGEPKDAGFLDNLQIIPFGSVQARLFPTSIPEPGNAELALFYYVEQDITVVLSLAQGTPETVRIGQPAQPQPQLELVLDPTRSTITAALTIEDDGIPQFEQSGTLTVSLSSDSLPVALIGATLTFTIPANDPPTLGFDRPSVTVQEGMESTVKIIITPALIGDVTINLSATSGTLDQNDFELPMLPKQINLVEGQTSAVVTITVKDDRIREQRETATLIIEVERGFARIAD